MGEVAQRTLEETSCGGEKTVVIHSIDHVVEGTTGKYFYFNKEDWIAMDGDYGAKDDSVSIDQWRDGSKIETKAVIVWDNNNGIHGRFVKNPNSGDWQVGDVISREADNCASVPVPTTFDGCSTNGGPQYSTTYGQQDPEQAIAFVNCCSMNGASCSRQKSGACYAGHKNDNNPVTYLQANQICADDGKRLCESQAEVDKCCDKGCGYDNHIVWAAVPGSRRRNLESQEIAGKADNDNTQDNDNVVF